MTHKPYPDSRLSKKPQVKSMFNKIAHRYDFLNHFLTFGFDRTWRRRALKNLKKRSPKRILDIATGTGDFAIEAAKSSPDKIIGIDISSEMLERGRIKIRKKNLDEVIELRMGDSENPEFKGGSFDAVTVAFGVRNYENLKKGLSEIFRVLTPGGLVIILEFSKPKSIWGKIIFYLIFKILPFWGMVFSKQKSAYRYLVESIKLFPDSEVFPDFLRKTGFKEIRANSMFFGIVTVYEALKVENN